MLLIELLVRRRHTPAASSSSSSAAALLEPGGRAETAVRRKFSYCGAQPAGAPTVRDRRRRAATEDQSPSAAVRPPPAAGRATAPSNKEDNLLPATTAPASIILPTCTARPPFGRRMATRTRLHLFAAQTLARPPPPRLRLFSSTLAGRPAMTESSIPHSFTPRSIRKKPPSPQSGRQLFAMSQ